MRILTVFGTRPEAIKLAPVVRTFEAEDGVTHACCVTAQHREMLDQVLRVFAITPNYDLNVMQQGQTLTQVTASVLDGVGDVIDDFRPDWVVVQGDTTTTFAGALAAFYRRTKVAHVEAGLRTNNIYSPYPEEMNRRLVSQLTTLHLAPTETAAANLRREGFADSAVLVTGNTVIDALQWVSGRLRDDEALAREMERRFDFLDPAKRLILVTGHRRENFEKALLEMCQALAAIADRGDVEVVFPVHLNPVVQATVRPVLGGRSAVHLIEPLEYLPFVALMMRSTLIVTDSGGIQEEAPDLGKPVLVMRDTTERPEAIEAGTARLIGREREPLLAAINELLDDSAAYAAMAQARNPFGDGRAAVRIRDRMLVR